TGARCGQLNKADDRKSGHPPSMRSRCSAQLPDLFSTGRDGSAVHSAIEPSYMLVFLLPSTSLRPNQAIEAQWPVLQKAIFFSSVPRPTASDSALTVSGWAKSA